MITQNQLFFLLLIILVFIEGCQTQPSDPLLEPIVSIESSTLTKRELLEAIPSNLQKEDSIIFTQNYIDRWVKTQLILRKAELNLSPEEKNVNKLLNDYRTSLLTHLYQQKLLEQKYSPLITSGEINDYYERMKEDFNLNEIIIKGVYIKIANTAPNLSKLERWFVSEDQKDLVNLEAYCFQNANKYDPFFDHWISFESINTEFPIPLKNANAVLKWKRVIKSSDDDFNYYLSIREIHFENETAPISYVTDKIKSILLNKKRIEFINKLEKDLLEEGEKQKLIKYY